jgi:DNA modification methylase
MARAGLSLPSILRAWHSVGRLLHAMKFLHTEIGSAKDNSSSPIHDWYKFAAGFSHRFVEEIVKQEHIEAGAACKIFDPFAGCGTTLVSCQKIGLAAVGNEAQRFMYDIIRSKLDWRIEATGISRYLQGIQRYVHRNSRKFDPEAEAHPLLSTLYDEDNLAELCLIRNYVRDLASTKYRLFFNTALSQVLHKVCVHPIAIPYISRRTTLSRSTRAWESFADACSKMLADTQALRDNRRTSRIYLHDSRKKNGSINDEECLICITSPPYLNNLDYGEVSKVHTYFFGYTRNWGEITNTVRKKLVTSSTTHYRISRLDLDAFRDTDFYASNRQIADSLIKKASEITLAREARSGRKSFDVLMLLYFKDMFDVLKETRRVVKRAGKAFLVLGDSAPYGVYIPTTRIIGRLSKNAGFNRYRVYNIRVRGTKWKSLRYRHSMELAESVLVVE